LCAGALAVQPLKAIGRPNPQMMRFRKPQIDDALFEVPLQALVLSH
jgi:hypothetical protein